jgi:hypothetical protein
MVSSAAVKAKVLVYGVMLLLTSLTTEVAQAAVGVKAGPQAGVALGNDAHPWVGFGLRLTAPSSPLTIQPTFQYVFDESQTLYHIAGNLLYEVPVDFRLKPYFGVGVNYGTFVLNKPAAPPMTSDRETSRDDEGHRLGLNLIAGARLELPWVSPFLQLTQGIGELDALAVGGGLELTLHERSGTSSLPESMRFAVTPYLANNVVGDVQSGRIGLGMSIAFNPWAHFGFELDGELHGHFFRDEDVAELVPEGVDLNTSAAIVSASAVARYC